MGYRKKYNIPDMNWLKALLHESKFFPLFWLIVNKYFSLVFLLTVFYVLCIHVHVQLAN